MFICSVLLRRAKQMSDLFLTFKLAFYMQHFNDKKLNLIIIIIFFDNLVTECDFR